MDVNSLLEQLAPLVKEYEEKKKKRMDTGFNVFYLISDYYYRETFHGDILYALLSPQEKHGGGTFFVELFIDMINEKKKLVDKKNYSTVTVKREFGTNDGNDAGRIDLLIVGEDNHYIVVENKLNNASDTYRQLPKYRKDLEETKRYTIDAFVYIPLNPYKRPDTFDWSEDEKKAIENKLVVIPAYEEGKTNLIDNWLSPAEKNKTSNDDARFIVKHYKELLKNLTIDVMDTIILEKFYNKLLQDNTLETAQKIRDMMKELPKYMTTRICDRYRKDNKFEPFEKVDLWNDNAGTHYCAYFEKAKIGEHSITIDVYCSDSGYKLRLWERGKTLSETDYDSIVNRINTLSEFEKKPVDDGFEGCCTRFRFEEEKKLFDYIDGILEELKKNIDKA